MWQQCSSVVACPTQWVRRPCTEMSQGFSASLLCTSPSSLVCEAPQSPLCSTPKQSLPHWTALICESLQTQLMELTANPCLLCQRTFTFYLMLFLVLLLGKMLKKSLILNLIFEGHMFHWLQTYLPPHHLLLFQIPGPYCAFLPCSNSYHPDYPVYLCICSPLTSLSPPDFHSFALCLHMPELQVWHSFILGSNAQLQRKSSWDCVGLEP